MVDRAFEEFLGSATATIPGYTWPHEFRGPFLPYPAIHLHHHAARTGRPRDVSLLLYFPPPQTSALWPGGPTEIQPATIPGNHAPPGQFPMQITGRYRPASVGSLPLQAVLVPPGRLAGRDRRQRDR